MRRKLSPDEAALWARVAGTVAPIDPRQACSGRGTVAAGAALMSPQARRNPSTSHYAAATPPSKPRGDLQPLDRQTLDAGWDRKLARGLIQPDFTIDLHGASLDAAHTRLDHALALALAQGARVVLLITGRPRPLGEHAGRSDRRGAIRAKFVDWLAVGSHASRIAAIRPAHPRHGGAGAVYLILRRINSGNR